jgi:hypothetical protein
LSEEEIEEIKLEIFDSNTFKLNAENSGPKIIISDEGIVNITYSGRSGKNKNISRKKHFFKDGIVLELI